MKLCLKNFNLNQYVLSCSHQSMKPNVITDKKMACFIRMFRNGIHGYLSISVYFLFCFLIPTNRFAGRPGDYVYVFNQYRMEEVNLDMCALCIIYTCHSAVTVITVINTVVIIILLEGPCCSFSVSFSFFSSSVCPWWLSY